jgi:hypothetical protein
MSVQASDMARCLSTGNLSTLTETSVAVVWPIQFIPITFLGGPWPVRESGSGVWVRWDTGGSIQTHNKPVCCVQIPEDKGSTPWSQQQRGAVWHTCTQPWERETLKD